MNEKYRLNEYEFYEIEKEAECFFMGLGTVTPPADCYEAAGLLKIELIQYSKLKEGVSGLFRAKFEEGFSVFNKNTGFQIYYNDSLSDEKIQETIWYEIAHIHLGHFDRGNKKSQEQMQAECLYFICLVAFFTIIAETLRGAA